MTRASQPPTVLLFREYLRVSVDESGQERSNDQQHAENVAEVERNPNWASSDLPHYSDVGSASRFARKRRLDFVALMQDLRTGAFGANVLQMWEASRGSRRASEWLTLLELCAETGVGIYVTTHRRLYDPANARDWKSLMEDAIDSEYESRKTALRVGRDMASSAAAGAVPGGRRAFGYSPSGMDIIEDEAAVIHDCVRRVLAGESVRSLAAALNRRGVKTSAGNDWHPGPLSKMLAGTRIAGIRTHNGAVTARGVWPAIIDEATHRRIVAVLAGRSPVGRRGRTAWLLTGLLRCDWCGELLGGNTDAASGTRRYHCRKAPGYKGCGRLVVKAEPLEELLGLLVTERYADAQARRTASTDVDDGQAEIDELGRLAAMRIEISEDKIAGRISRETAAEDAAAVDRRQRDVEALLAAKVHAVSPLDFIAEAGLLSGRWTDLDVENQRVVLKAMIAHVTVGPSTRRGSNAFEAERVTAPGRIAWKV